MKELIKKLLRESLEELSQKEIEDINKAVEEEIKLNNKNIEELKQDIENQKILIKNFTTKSSELSKIPKDVIDNIVKKLEDKLKNFEVYLKNSIKANNKKEIFDRKYNHFVKEKKWQEERLKARENKTFNNQDLIDLFVTALEGGSNYWYMIRHLPKDVKYKVKQLHQPTSEAIGEHILKGGYIQFYDIEEDYDDDDYQEKHSEKGLLGTVDMNSILEAITIIKKDYPEVWENIMDENFDANDADIFLQLCVMGDVIFG